MRFEQGGSVVQFVDVGSSYLYSLDLHVSASDGTPVTELVSVQSARANEWILQTTNEAVVYSLTRDGDQFTLKEASVKKAGKEAADTRLSVFPQSPMLSALADSSSSASPLLMVHPDAFLQMVKTQGASSLTIQSALREPSRPRWGIQSAWRSAEGSVVANAKSDDTQVDLEVTFPGMHSTKTVVLGAANGVSTDSVLPRVTSVAGVHDGRHLVTLQENGAVRFWQLDQAAVDDDVALWRQMFGVTDRENNHLELKLNGQAIQHESTPRTGLDRPKYGKDDPKNEPHVGGNTWAGGTGGSDTAGLGGRGGPYRLDKGHPVHQVSQAKKDEVSAEVRAAARAIADEALAAKLQEIDMSAREWETYQSYYARVEHEGAQLRAILANLESVAQERTWLKHQASGELDDAKLVDGVTGERLVFKKRGVSDSPFHYTQTRRTPTRMLFVMDVSGSMYRFNGQDGRLERVLETSLMIMESFAGFETKFDYAIMGHSGDAPVIPFVDFGAPPADRKERLKVDSIFRYRHPRLWLVVDVICGCGVGLHCRFSRRWSRTRSTAAAATTRSRRSSVRCSKSHRPTQTISTSL